MLAGMIAAGAALDDSDAHVIIVPPSDGTASTPVVLHHWSLADTTDTGQSSLPWPDPPADPNRTGGTFMSAGNDHWWRKTGDFMVPIYASCPHGWRFEFYFKRTQTMTNSVMRLLFSDGAANFTHDVTGAHHHTAPFIRFNFGASLPPGMPSDQSCITLYEDPVGIPHDITPEWTSPGLAGINDVNLWYHHEVTYDVVTKEFEWYVDGNHMFTHASSGAYGKVNGIVFSAHPHGDFKEIKLTAAPAKVELK
jgi:hypothetical protein